jgi:uncharacterized delta-60 repeat protein
MKVQPARRWILSVALALLAACGSEKPDPTPDGGVPDGGTDPKPGQFTLAVSSTQLPVIQQGSSVLFKVAVTRQSGFTGAVNLSLSGLPTGVSGPSPTIASDSGSADLPLTATATAPHSLPTTVTVTGTSGDQVATKTFTVTVSGPPGSIDTSFGSGGPVITAVNAGEDYARAIAVQPDGKIVVAGSTITPQQGTDFAVVRYDRDGALDTAFNAGGKVTTAISTGTDEANAVAIQSDGKILVAGSTNEGTSIQRFVVARYNSNGSLDTTFGTGGKVITSFGSGPDRAYAMAVQPDGKIVVGGEATVAATGLDFALARYNTDGSLDTGFGTGGKVTTPVQGSTGRDAIYALALQTLGGETRIVAAGGEGDFRVARFTANGTPDSSFAGNGKVSGIFGSSIGAAYGVAITSVGRIVVAGYTSNDFALARVDETGVLDSSFGTAGKVVTRLNTGNTDLASSVAIQSDGKIVAAGWVNAGATSAADFALLRFSATGELDSSFGSGGISITPVAASGKSDKANAMVLQQDDRVPTVRILVAGQADGTNSDFALTRYWQ